MAVKIALAGNPNCGKTTLFNALTGANQYVGNWPGVTVEKKEDQPKTYTEGQFHYLPGIEKPDQWQTKNHIDPILSIANFTNGYVGESLIPEVARENGEFFAENSQVAVPLPMTSELSNNIGDINTASTYVIAQVALGYMTVDEGMDYYNKTVGSLSNAVLKSLNK